MAKIIPSAIISTISGSIDAMTFRRSRNGIVLAKRAQKVYNNSDDTQDVHRAFNTAMTFWSRVDDETRRAWAVAAQSYPHRDRLGQSRRLSGKQLFVRQFAWNGGTPYSGSNLPPIVSTPTIETLTATPGADIITVAWTLFNDPGVNVRVKVRGYRPYSTGQIGHVPKWTYLGIQTGSYDNDLVVTPASWPGAQDYQTDEYIVFQLTPMAYAHWLAAPAQVQVQY